MIMNFSEATLSELLAYINNYEQDRSWRDLDISCYQEALSCAWERMDMENKSSKLGIGIFNRLNYFSKTHNPSIDNLLQFLKHNKQCEDMCNWMCK